ncbi:MAG TPA: GatB/YqeY domain-containing protein [Candidatus Binataceae bacterium]|nr:GatB/YqeY domain-containing protein [Candidatus Binataceae bacterium]
MKARFQDDLKTAMKARDTARVMTIRGILTEITRLEKEVCRPANETEIVQILKRERARREEALGFARQGNRPDLIAQNETEARILDAYIPAGVGAEEIRAVIETKIAAGAAQIGPLMKALKDEFGARLDGKLASELVKEALARKDA